MTCFCEEDASTKADILSFLDWALFMTVPRHRVTWEDPALSVAAGKTVIS